MNKKIKNINTSDVTLKPVGPRVLFKVYEDNPYKKVDISEEGVIFGVAGTNMHKSNETGEMENDLSVIVCAHVVSVGDACKWVKEGDDVFLCRAFSTPVPFRNEKLFMTDENNVMCVINKNE